MCRCLLRLFFPKSWFPLRRSGNVGAGTGGTAHSLAPARHPVKTSARRLAGARSSFESGDGFHYNGRCLGALLLHTGEKSIIRRAGALLLVLILAGGFSRVSAAVEEAVLQVEGMTCPLCVRGIQESLGRLAGVGAVEADLGTGRVRLAAQSGRSLDLQEIRGRILKLGFRPAREAVIRATGNVNVGPRDRLTFRVLGTTENYVLLEGAELRRLLISLRVASGAGVELRGRIHRHPERLPPSLSVLSYEVKTP